MATQSSGDKGLSSENAAFLAAMEEAEKNGRLSGEQLEIMNEFRSRGMLKAREQAAAAPASRSQQIEARRTEAFDQYGPLGGLASLPGNLKDRAATVAESRFQEPDGSVNYFDNPVGQTLWQGLQGIGDVTSAFSGDLARGAVQKLDPTSVFWKEAAGFAGDVMSPGAWTKGAAMAGKHLGTAGKAVEKTVQMVNSMIPSVLMRVAPSLKGKFSVKAEDAIARYLPQGIDPTGEVIGKQFISEFNPLFKQASKIQDDLYLVARDLPPGKWEASTDGIIDTAKEVMRVSAAANEGAGGLASGHADRLLARMSSVKGVERIPSFRDAHGIPMNDVIDKAVDMKTMPYQDIVDTIRTLNGEIHKAPSQTERGRLIMLNNSLRGALDDLVTSQPTLAPAKAALDAANKYTKDTFSPMYGMKSTAQKLSKLDATQIVPELFFKSLSPEQVLQVKAAIMPGANGQEIWRGLGEAAFARMATKASAMEKGGKLDLQKFVAEWAKMPEGIRQTITFGPQHYKDVNKMMTEIGQLSAVQANKMKGGTDKFVMAGGIYHSLNQMSFVPMAIALAVQKGVGVLANVMNNPKAMRLLSAGVDPKRKEQLTKRLSQFNSLLHEADIAVSRASYEDEASQQMSQDEARRALQSIRKPAGGQQGQGR